MLEFKSFWSDALLGLDGRWDFLVPISPNKDTIIIIIGKMIELDLPQHYIIH
jgi:hypothetical protein